MLALRARAAPERKSTIVEVAGPAVRVRAIAAQGKDKTSIRFARLVEKAFGGFEPPPGYD
jgi:hypothetical protein